MDQVNLEFKLKTDKADAAMAESAKRGRDLFEKKGFKLNVRTGDLPLGRITGDFEKFQGSLDAATARVLAFTATTSVIYGLSSAFTRLFTDSVKLEKQLAGIQAILQTSNNNLKQFSDELFKVANTTGQSFDVAAAAASEFARQGLSVEETLKATTSALVFSKIAGVDAAQAVENLTASINTFGNEALSYTDVVDTIVSLDNAFAISAGGIADGLKRVGSVASESGIQLKEIASLISVVQQVSARGAPVISNGLKTIFTRLGRQQVQESLNGIGVATQSANGEFRSQIDILTDLSTRLDTLSDSQRAFILEQVAGVYQINTLQATLKALSGEYSLFDKAVKVASDSSGNAAERLKILTDTTDANLQRLKNNVTQFLAEVGSATVKPLLDNFVGIGNKILETLNLGAAAKEGEEAGLSLGSFLLNGISSALSGPGTILIVATVAKLLGKITKDALSALQTLSGLKQASLVDSQTQRSINEAIAQGNKALVARLATTTSIVEKTAILNKLLSDIAVKQGAAQVNQAVSAGLAANKKTGPSRGKSKGFVPSYFGGFIPKNIERQEQMGARSGGYVPGDVVPSPVGGVMNTAESVVYSSSKYEPFINPPENSIAGINHKRKSIESTGINPYGIEKGLASRGFIPNFAYKVSKQNLGKNSVISIDGNVTGRQSSLVADSNKDNVVNLKYKVRQVENTYKDNFKNSVLEYQKSGYNDSNWKSIESQLMGSKYTEEQIKTFKENLDSKGTTGKSLITGKNVSLNRQITGIQSKLKGAYFENVVGNLLGKAISRKKVKVPESQNSRMDLLNSKGNSLGEIKSGQFNYDNLASKAIASLSQEKNEKYRDGKPQDIEFEKPYSLFVPKSSAGFIPNFASKYTQARQQKRDELRASLFNIGDFAGGAIKNVNAQTEFNQARDKNPNVEFDDKINQVGFKTERIPIPDKQFEASLRSKTENKNVTTKFENYAIDYLNTRGYSFKPGRNTLYGKENASVDGYNIKQNFIELLEVKGGGWDAPDVSNKFGRFAPENLVDLAPQLVSKFFKEGNPDPNINDKIRIRNVLAIPALTGGVFKSNINAKYPSADLKAMEKQRQKKTGKKIPAKFAWMKGIIEQGPITNFSGFIPNFASRLSYKETQKAQKEAVDREVASGQKRKNVKVGKNNSLRTALNPMGFGVFNKDEKTLANGMSLAKKQGIDPRSKGMFASEGFIPNFAENKDGSNFFIGSLKKAWAAYSEFFDDTVEMIQKVASGELNTPSRQGYTQNKGTDQAKSFSVLKEISNSLNKIEQDESLKSDYAQNIGSLRDKREKSGTLGKEGGMQVKGSESRNLAADETRAIRKTLAEAKKGTQRRELTYSKPEELGLSAENARISIRKKVSDQKELIVSNPELLSQYEKNADEAITKKIPTGEQFLPGLEGGMKDKKSRARNLAAIETRAVRKTIADSKKQSSQINTSNQASPSLPNLPNSTIPDNPANISAADRMRGVKPINNPSSVPTFPSSVPPPRIPLNPVQPVPTDPASPNLPKRPPSKMRQLMDRGSGMGSVVASMAIPAVVGGLLPEEGKRTQGQQTAANVAESAGSGIMAASMASMVPQLAKFGPTIGLVVGGFTLLSKSAKNAVPSIKKLQDENNKLIASNEKQVTSLNTAVAKQEEISQLRASGADPKKIAKAQLDFTKSLSGIGDIGLQKTLLTEKDDTKRQEAVMQFQEKKRKETDFSQGVLATAALSKNEGDQRASGIRGAAAYSQDLLSQASSFLGIDPLTKAIGLGSATEGFAQNADIIRGPKKNLTTDEFDTFLNPIIASLDLSKLSSKEAAIGLKQLAGGTMDMGTFLKKFGEELGLSSGQVRQASETFAGLSDNFSQDSINRMNEYAGGVIKFNSTLQEIASKPPTVNINFQKVLDKALQDLTFDTALTNYKNFANATANLDIKESQLTIDQGLGKITPEQVVRKRSELTGEKEKLGFEQKSTAILDEAVQGVLAVIPKNLDQGTQSSIVSAAKSSLTQGGDITVLQDIIKQSLGASEDSNKILEQIEALNQKTVQSLEMLNVDMAAAEKVRQAQTEQQLSAIQAQNSKDLGERALTGDVGSEFNLLDPVAAAKLEKEISDLRDKATKAGVGTAAGKKYSEQANAKSLELNQMRAESRKAEKEMFGKEYTQNVDSIGLGDTMGQQAETDYILELVKKLSGAVGTETGGVGVTKESMEKIRAALMSGDKAGAKSILESQGAIGGKEGTARKALSDDISKFLDQVRASSTSQAAAAAGAPAAGAPAAGAPATGAPATGAPAAGAPAAAGVPTAAAAGMPTPQMPGVSVPGAATATGAPAAVGSPTATGVPMPQIPGAEIPQPSAAVSPASSALARLRDNTMLERIGQQDLLDRAAKDESIKGAQKADEDARAAENELATFNSTQNLASQEAGNTVTQTGLSGLQDLVDKTGKTTFSEKTGLQQAGTIAGAVLTPTALFQGLEYAGRQGVGSIAGALGNEKAAESIKAGSSFGNYGIRSVQSYEEGANTQADLQEFTDKLKAGMATQEDFNLLEESSKLQVKDKKTGQMVKNTRTDEDRLDREKYVQAVKASGVKFAEDPREVTAKRKELEQKASDARAAAEQKKSAAAEKISQLESQAADPTGTFQFLKDPKQRQAAVEKFQQSKDPKLQAFAKKIEQDDINKKKLEEANKLTEDRKTTVDKGVSNVKADIESSRTLSKEDKFKANEALSQFQQGKIGLEDDSLKQFGLDQKLRESTIELRDLKPNDMTSDNVYYQDRVAQMQSEALDYKSSSENQAAAKKNALQSGTAVKDAGKGAIGAVNRTIYGDQVSPTVMGMVQDTEGKKAIEAYNSSVVERDAKREELSGIDTSLQESQSADASRQEIAKKAKRALSQTGQTLPPEEYSKRQLALTQYASGKEMDDKSLDSVRSELIKAAGGQDTFDEINSKSGGGKTEQLQADRKRIAEQLATGESKTAELQTMMMEYLKTVTGAANQRDTAQSVGVMGGANEQKPTEQTPSQNVTTEKREITASITVKVEGDATPQFIAAMRPTIVEVFDERAREMNKNAGQPPPQSGPPVAMV